MPLVHDQSAKGQTDLVCSGDDWDCYNAAQRSLLSDLHHYGTGSSNTEAAAAAATTAPAATPPPTTSHTSAPEHQNSGAASSRVNDKVCTVVITGDYHYGDIKRLVPGSATQYADWLGSADFSKPLLQAGPVVDASA